MAQGMTFHLEGLREVEKALGEMKKATAKAVLRRAGTKALTPMVETARANLAAQIKGRKLTKRQQRRVRTVQKMGVSTRLSRRQGSAHRRMFASDRASVEMFGGVASSRHAHLIEFGSGHRQNRKIRGKALSKPRSTGRMPRMPFMRPAWDAHKHGMVESIGRDLAEEVQRTAARLAARAAKTR
jgi:hypothetical protein